MPSANMDATLLPTTAAGRLETVRRRWCPTANSLRYLIISVFLGLGTFQFLAITINYMRNGPLHLAQQHHHQRRFCSGVCIEVDLTSTQPVSPVMFGAFFEEINHAGEGGLHPELLRDRSFDARAYLANPPKAQMLNSSSAPPAVRSTSKLQAESMDPTGVAKGELQDLQAWEASGTAKLSLLPLEGNKHAVRLSASGFAQLVNHGHSLQGFFLRKDMAYTFTIVARAAEEPPRDLIALLTSSDGSRVYCQTRLRRVGSDWTRTTVQLTPNSDDHSARFVIRFNGPGTLDLDYVSLIQTSHFGEKGSLVPFDPAILKLLKELKPSFLRFPGGAYVEGVDMNSAYRWKSAIGPPEDRPGHPNANWGYWCTDSLGLFEFMTLAGELHAEPVLVVNVGISQTQSVQPADLMPYIQDVMDELEFVMGNASSTWGKVRASMGRVEPWALKYLTLGNEDCLRPWYAQHYANFSAAVRSTYPHLKLLANCDLGNGSDYDMWEFHTYRDPQQLYELGAVLDAHQGDKPVAVTEFAAMQGGETLVAAIAEAAFMSALERNSHKVMMAAYAPLLSHSILRTWRPDLIVYEGSDTGNVYGTPSYYVQQLYMVYQGVKSANCKIRYGVDADNNTSHLVVASATCLDDTCSQTAIKVVNLSPAPQEVTVYFSRSSVRGKHLAELGTKTTLTSKASSDGNSFVEPRKVAPVTETIDIKEQTRMKVAPYSLTVLRMNLVSLNTSGQARVIFADLEHTIIPLLE